MKRIFILLQVVAIHLVVFSQSNYNLKFEENEFSFLETEIGYQILPKSVDYYLLGDTTLPALPYKTIHILIPENTDVENVNVSIKSEEILQNIYLIRNPVEKPVSANSNNNSNLSNYSEKMHPYKNLKFETVIKSQGFYMAVFSVCPFIYDTQKRSLELITDLQELYEVGKTTDKKYRFQPQIVAKYQKTVAILKSVSRVEDLFPYNGLKYEVLKGVKEGIESVRVNDQYRIEFTTITAVSETVLTICNIKELSNHYK